LGLNGTHQLLVHANDVNLLDENMNTINRNIEGPFDAREGADLEVNAEETKYMIMPHNQKAGQNYDIKISNKLFENVVTFKYMGMTVTNHNGVLKN
jgi:hypothetical protein